MTSFQHWHVNLAFAGGTIETRSHSAIALPECLVIHKVASLTNLVRLHPNGDFGMHSRDAYPQFADVWVLPGYHIEYLHISEYVFVITPGYLAS